MKWTLPAVLVLCAVFVGCAPLASEGDFESDNPASLLYAIEHAGRERDSAAIEHLVQALEHDDPAVRMMAINALDRITGQRLDYNPYAAQIERREMVKVWVDAVREGRFE